MDKWADYCISGVRYSTDKKHIDKVEVRKDEGDELGSPEIWTRQDVISKIENGFTIITVYKNNGRWKKGEEVHIVEVKGEKYIRTDKNEIEEDNLGELPEI